MTTTQRKNEMMDARLIELVNRATNDSRRIMLEIRASGPWTSVLFFVVGGTLMFRRAPITDTAGARVAF